MPFGDFTDAGGHRHSVNVLTAEEPTDWGGGSGLYDAFIEVGPASSMESLGHLRPGQVSQDVLAKPAFRGVG
jgi:hypothetical protein